MIAFTEAPGSDGTQPQDQDSLTPLVVLTRGYQMGLFNAVTETGYTHLVSPAGTEWAFGELADYASLTYNPWEIWNHKTPPLMVGQDAVLHLISENIYLSVQFTAWAGPGTGFSYVRSTPVPEPSVPALLAVGVVGMSIVRRRRNSK